MLTSSTNQYLRPEYLTPLPTTLDAKKSPLALLAQTCSQIGVDLPSGKSLLAPPDKSKSAKTSSSEQSPREKASPHHHNSSASSTSSLESTKSSSFKPYESCVTRDKAMSSSPDQQRVPSAHSTSGSNSRSRTPANGKQRCSSNQSASSSGGREGRKSATPGNDATRESPRIPTMETARSVAAGSPSLPKPAHSVLSSQDYFRPSALSLVSSSAAVSSGATTTTTPSAAAYGLPFPPQFPPMDPVTASSLLSQHHAALKNGLAGNPYLGYARMKTPSGADTLVPVCRDPYCTGCQLNSHLLGSQPAKMPPTSQPGPTNGATCPAGCTQCDHKPGASSAAAAAAAAAAASSPYAAYAHAHFVALAAASQMPYACNWIGADAAYCGKRFASSDELLQHIRSHTGQGTPESGAAAAAATTAAALSLLSPPGLGPGHPLLSRSYPTPPLSPLAAARYHPYGGKPYGVSPLSGLGLPLAPPPPPHPAGLSPYFSPYASLYANSRLGAASGMHP